MSMSSLRVVVVRSHVFIDECAAESVLDKEPIEHSTSTEPADVCPECDTTSVVGDREYTDAADELPNEPRTDVEQSRQLNEVGQEENRKEKHNSAVREEEHVRCHDSRDGTRGTDCGDGRSRID